MTKIGAYVAKKKNKKDVAKDVEWATLIQNETAKLRHQEKKKLRKLEKKSTDSGQELLNGTHADTIEPTSVKVHSSVKL